MAFLPDFTKKNKSSQIPLKWILIVPFVLQVGISVGIVGYLSYRSAQRSIENVAQNLMTEIGAKVEKHLDTYLQTAQQVNLLNKQVLESGIIDRTDFETLGKYFWQQIQQYNFTYVNYGTTTQEFIGAGYFKNVLEIAQIKSPDINNLYSYKVDEKGNRIYPPRIFAGHTPNDAEWYHQAKQVQKPLWSPIYNWTDKSEEIAISASAPVYSESQEFLGVVGIDLSLSNISKFLQTLEIGKTGQVFILDKSGLLVASCTKNQPYKIIDGDAKRIPVTQMSSDLSKKTVNILYSQLPNFPQGIETENNFISYSGLFIQVIPYQDNYGIDWLMVITIPQSDFMVEIEENKQNILIVSGITLITTTIMGIITTKWITKPILKISQTSQSIIKGEAKNYLPEATSIQEINTLSYSISVMATKLQEALNQSENRYRQVVEQQTDFIIRSNPDTSITFTNEALCFALGCTLEEVIGKKWLDFANPEDLKTTLVKITQLTPENSSFRTENRDNRRNGDIGWTQWINQGIFNENGQLIEIQSVGRDITEQKIAEIALKKSEARFQKMAISSPGIIYIIVQRPDGSRYFEYISSVVEEILEISAEEVLNNPDSFLSLFYPDDIAGFEQAMMDNIQTMEAFTYQWRMITPSGKIKWLQANDRPELRDNGDIAWTGVILDVTKQLEMQHRLDELARHIPGMIYQYRLRVDGTSHFPYASEGIKQIYNVTPLDVKESADKVLDVLHPEDRERILDSVFESADKLTPWHCEYRVCLPENKIIWVEGNATPQREADGSVIWHGYITNITDRKQAEETLRQSERKYHQILDSISDLIVVKNPQFQIIWANKAFRDYYRMTLEEMQGIVDAHFNNPDFTQQYIRDDAFVFNTGEVLNIPEEFATRYDGEIHPFSTIKSPIFDDNGEVIMLVAVAREITEKRQAEIALSQAKETAEAATKAKSQFLANMSHEIRTPMNGVLGMAELLSLSTLNSNQKEYINIIQESCKTLLTIINDILDFSKTESGMLTLDKQPLNLEDILKSVCHLFSKQAKDNHILLKYEIKNPLPKILGDSSRLQQIFFNLVGNAIKFTSQGEVNIIVHSDTANFAEDEEIELMIKIEDSGVGIDNDRITQLFQPFTQADATISRKYGGTGLGLAICKNLVALMGGTIWVESNGNMGGLPPWDWVVKPSQKQGSTFYFTLKLTTVTDDVITEDSIPTQAKNLCSIDTSKVKILIAEDNKVNQKVLLLTLKKLGYTADIASNGVEVLNLLETQCYDVIFMDMQMPEMDGVTATKIIRASSQHQPYIIALTANALEVDREICVSAGMDNFITKPIKINEIDRALQLTINN
ncbi:PAS domain S-box protein [Geminocystis herdmanii]|uniref:PAS domain S-box protein n=1 Tax=Geminocystis herdmanii TaxID=669359 RepID=UPI00034C32ED|nr:PAS domain S-box protein [Geminocystis herdmanii]